MTFYLTKDFQKPATTMSLAGHMKLPICLPMSRTTLFFIGKRATLLPITLTP